MATDASMMGRGRDCAMMMTCSSNDDDDDGSLLMRRRRRHSSGLHHQRRRRVPKRFPLELQKAIRDVQFIQNHMKRADEYDEVSLFFHPPVITFLSVQRRRYAMDL
jgi:nicotinic acetylcholine receptor